MQKAHLQFHGERRAVPVGRLREGDVTVWDGGYGRVVAGVGASPSGKTFRTRYADGAPDGRRMRAGRPVAVR